MNSRNMFTMHYKLVKDKMVFNATQGNSAILVVCSSKYMVWLLEFIINGLTYMSEQRSWCHHKH